MVRLSDGFVSLAHKNNVKVYDPNSDLFKNLIPEIKELCTKLDDSNELKREDYNLLLKVDSFEVPDSILSLIKNDPNEILKKEFGEDQDTDPSQPGTSKD